MDVAAVVVAGGLGRGENVHRIGACAVLLDEASHFVLRVFATRALGVIDVDEVVGVEVGVYGDAQQAPLRAGADVIGEHGIGQQSAVGEQAHAAVLLRVEQAP